MKIKQIAPQEHKFTEVVGGIAFKHKMLYYRGILPDLNGFGDFADSGEKRPVVAVVGSRKPSKYGREVAYSLAYELAKAGCVVVSGLALGVDAIAHRACLDAGGTTVAVLGTAIDRLYPASNLGLGEEILRSGGAVLSEYAPSEATDTRYSFPQRNRIVSGLSDAVVVVEAALGSGSLITADWASKQGRKVYAVPGNIDSVLSAGCNWLIAGGAGLVTSVDDLVAEVVGARVVSKQAELGLGAQETPDMEGLSAAEVLAELTQREMRRFG